MISALEKAGHRCVVYIRDEHGWSIDQHRRAVREWWPWVTADVRGLEEGIEDSQVLFATCWDSVYSAIGSAALGRRCYFVQDFEPAFYPAGSEYLLAEATYSVGFHGVTAGPWLAAKLNRDYGMPTEFINFGCDLESYQIDRSVQADSRQAVCYYCRPSTPRRAHELAVLALELFATRHPECEIRLYGEPCEQLPFASKHLGLLTPVDLNTLYNECVAGLVLSATNVSLVPHEMLAAGCVPVVNDAEHNKMVLNNPHVRYSRPTPYDLADALCAVVERPAFERSLSAEGAAASVESMSWAVSGDEFVRIVERLGCEIASDVEGD